MDTNKQFNDFNTIPALRLAVVGSAVLYRLCLSWSALKAFKAYRMSYRLALKKFCMSARHSSSNTPDVTAALGCRASGACF
ncbi:hypothetical protein SAMN04487825_103164 [Prevotella sp. kh1p2]|nr:hypothetical protein SAMN04487825_103164 [Prevotella sp. kh1p2]SNU10453.1 hypothetical protein SAMN06298210_1036 [Prevotellaceae bacterium KH2P17]